MAKINIIQQPISTQDFQIKMRKSKKNHNFELCKALCFTRIDPWKAKIESWYSCQHSRVPRIFEKLLQKGKDWSLPLKDRVLQEYSLEIPLPALVWNFYLISTKGSNLNPKGSSPDDQDSILVLKLLIFPRPFLSLLFHEISIDIFFNSWVHYSSECSSSG